MGTNSEIAWTHHTFNPWRGCTKVSEGCRNCYAETMSKRNPSVLGIWGDNGTRVIAAESYWRQPFAWNKAAERAGERHRVFCASLADVFEDRPELREPRWRLAYTIAMTEHLDWLLLTKRPENIRRLWFEMLCPQGVPPDFEPIPNLWFGTSVEDQATADARIPHLLQCPAAVRFVSCEPMLGPVDLSLIDIRTPKRTPTVRRVMDGVSDWCRLNGVDTLLSTDEHDPMLRPIHGNPSHIDCLRRLYFTKKDADGFGTGVGFSMTVGIDWAIIGGESGPHHRPLDIDEAQRLANQCKEASVPVFVKQDSGLRPGQQGRLSDEMWSLKEFPNAD